MADDNDYQRTGPLDPSKWEEKPAVTNRPNDTPLREDTPAVANSTLADRQRAREEGKTLPLSGGPANPANSTLADRAAARGVKRVDGDEAENKAVTAAKTKRPARKR